MSWSIKRPRTYWLLLGLGFILATAGCGSFMARRMVQAPNTYPQWVAQAAPVLLDFQPDFFTNFPAHYASVGPPAARLCYRLVEPRDYHLTATSTNWWEDERQRTLFAFRADLPGRTNAWTARPRGTVVLLHGYALAQFSMMPWALRLAEAGWRCVVVDLRGHGRSSGGQIYYGLQEGRDLSQLLDRLETTGRVTPPVSVMGESYGAVMALRWKTSDPRIKAVVAITPYAGLSNAVLNVRSEYASWVPKYFIRAGLKKLPGLLDTTPDQLDTTTVLRWAPVTALFVAADHDKITPASDVASLYALAAPGSQLLAVPDSTHETVTYHLADLVPPILAWLPGNSPSP